MERDAAEVSQICCADKTLGALRVRAASLSARLLLSEGSDPAAAQLA